MENEDYVEDMPYELPPLVKSKISPRKYKKVKRKKYWFRVSFGKWEGDSFEPDASNIHVQSENALQAIKKVLKNTDSEEGEVVIGVEYLGYPQL